MLAVHPIPYQGSKRMLADVILQFFPRRVERLLEPFAGSAAVSLAAVFHKKANSIILNDKNSALMELWEVIIQDPGKIASQYRRLWEDQAGREREYYDSVRAEFNRTRRPDYFLYLLARCVKASVRYNANGDFNQSPDNRRKGAHPDTMERHIRQASQLLQGKTRTYNLDYREVLAMAKKGDLVYLDPPYQGVCSNRDSRYIENILFQDFAEALEKLNVKNIMYIISYDGRTGEKSYGRRLPDALALKQLEVEAGRSSQATLLGREDRTYESLYLSPALTTQLQKFPQDLKPKGDRQLSLFKEFL
jgi:DNA adenine methylase